VLKVVPIGIPWRPLATHHPASLIQFLIFGAL